MARILNQLLGKYVVDLDTENLNVGIFSGHVQLTDLKLKPEALVREKIKHTVLPFYKYIYRALRIRTNTGQIQESLKISHFNQTYLYTKLQTGGITTNSRRI